MAFATATLLLILVFVGVPLQVTTGNVGVVNIVGTIHGFLYLLYLVVAFQLSRKLSIPKWQVLLVLLAGTVPFCAFVAERKLTRRFASISSIAPSDERDGVNRRGEFRRRWLSRHALLLHCEVLVVAPGCAVAGWWQATRALAGNGLSWAYSVEWPIFALLAVAGWWRLIHEDPEAYRARKATPPTDGTTVRNSERPALLGVETEAVILDTATDRMATALALAVAVELSLGVVTLLFVHPSRPSGFLPAEGRGIYLAHVGVGLALGFGAIVLVARVRRASRISRLSGSFGLAGVASAAIGGLLTWPHALRLAGMVIMFVGSVISIFGYLFPTFQKFDRSE
jgi:integral membrane protein